MVTKKTPSKKPVKPVAKAPSKATTRPNASISAPTTVLPIKRGAKAIDGQVDNTRRQLKIDDSTYELMKEIGGGNASLGIREAGRRLIEHKDIGPFDAERHAARAMAR